jgi:hypothetical protein
MHIEDRPDTLLEARFATSEVAIPEPVQTRS